MKTYKINEQHNNGAKRSDTCSQYRARNLADAIAQWEIDLQRMGYPVDHQFGEGYTRTYHAQRSCLLRGEAQIVIYVAEGA